MGKFEDVSFEVKAAKVLVLTGLVWIGRSGDPARDIRRR